MKYIFLFLIIGSSLRCKAQKYILLDKAISQPAFYSDRITPVDKFRGFFPVEKKEIEKFLEALEEISKRLSSKQIIGKAKDYQMGCVRFAGVSIALVKGERLDYMLTSTCDDIKITMHLCDAKINNEDNAYFINTWIKYIKNAIK